MAKVQKIPQQVETKVVVIEEERFVLTLSRDEIKTLYVVTQKVGGDPEASPRGHIESIARAIELADESIHDQIYDRGYDGYARLSRFLANSGGIAFKNGSIND